MLEHLLNSSAVKFSPVTAQDEHDGDCESLIAHSNTSEELKAPSRHLSMPILSLLGLLFVTTFAVAAVLGAWLGSRGQWFSNPDRFCASHVSQYSPLIDVIDMKYERVQFNGSLLKENIFRQNAKPEVDEAWKSLGVDYRAVIIPTELAAKSGLTPDQAQVSEKYGGGYPANVEGLHHLHCLNLLRQALYFNFDYYHKMGEGAFKNDDDILRFHVTHCLDILRHQLMCSVDTGVLGQVWWIKETPYAYPDFNTVHKCKNFDGVRQWAQDHQAPKDFPDDYMRAPISLDAVYPEIP